MKNLLLFAFATFLLACGETSTRSSTESSNPDGEASVNPDTVAAVCIWNNISVRESADGESKWLTSVSLGEEVRSTQIIQVDSANDNREYVRVILADGKEGWTLNDFIIPEAEPMVFVKETTIFDRPDLLTKTEKKFKPMDIVAVKERDGEWAQVVGRSFGARWITEGWIKFENLTSEKVDIAAAKFAQEAMSKEDQQELIKSLDELLSTEELQTTIFYPVLEQKYDSLTAPAEMSMENDSTM